MTAKTITLRCFRNIRAARVEFHPELTLLQGRNAQGKTNLLEAVFIASWGGSFRTRTDEDLITEGKSSANISLSFDSRGREQNISCSFFKDKRREISVNGVAVKKAAELYGRFAAVLFVPSHLEIVSGAPEERRRFLDMALCRERPATAALLGRYRRALEQRNRLLKDMRRFSGLEDTLGVWDIRLAELGGALSAARAEFCGRLSETAAAIYAELAGGEALRLEFEPCSGTTAEQALSALQQGINDDMRCGYTTAGAHRDDIRISVAGRDGRRFASQGQQRSAVIAMKLAEAELLRQASGEPPVLLLDDVLSELDAGRRGFLLDRLSGMQRIVTSCDIADYGGCRVYTVENGSLTEEATGAPVAG